MSDWWDRVLGAPPGRGPARAPATRPDNLSPANLSPAPPPPVEGVVLASDGSNIAEGAAAWTGTAAAQAEQACPQCRTGTLYSRALSESGMPYRVPPAGQCFECGFPLVQAGSMTGPASGVAPTGTKAARQLPANHVVESGGVAFPPPKSRR